MRQYLNSFSVLSCLLYSTEDLFNNGYCNSQPSWKSTNITIFYFRLVFQTKTASPTYPQWCFTLTNDVIRIPEIGREAPSGRCRASLVPYKSRGQSTEGTRSNVRYDKWTYDANWQSLSAAQEGGGPLYARYESLTAYNLPCLPVRFILGW